MDYLSGSSAIYAKLMPLSCLGDNDELLRLNDLVSASHSFFRSTKNLDEEVANLRNIYETELEKLRKEIDTGVHERNSLHVQCNTKQMCVLELQNKLSVETDKNNKLLEEISMLQRNAGDFDSSLQDRDGTIQQPQEGLNQLRTYVDNLSREVNHWKQRWEHEQMANQEKEKRLQQLIEKIEFSDQVHDQEIKYYKARLDVASTTILNLEARIKELNSPNVSMNELPKQAPTDKAKVELNCPTESLKEHTRKGTDLPPQKETLECAITAEDNQATAGSIQELVREIREVYDKLTVKMSEVANDGESNINLQSEIETLKVLLEKEERRLKVPSDKDTTLHAKASKLTGTDQALKPTISEALQEKNYQLGISTAIHKPVADWQKTGTTIQGNNSSQLPASFAITNAATSVPITSYRTTGYDYSSSYPYASGVTSSVYPYEHSPPINTFYIPKELRSAEKCTLDSVADFDAELATSGMHMSSSLLPLTGPQYSHTSLYNQMQDSALSLTSLALGPIHARSATDTKNAQAHLDGTENNGYEQTGTSENERNFNITNFESSHDNIDERTRSGQLERLTSSIPNCTDSTFSAIGDLKIMEVSENGQFVRLLNDGPAEIDFGGYLVQQIVSDHPVAVFRFPPNTKVPPDSTVTVWSALSDPSMHNPPTDFFWQQQRKWETGPNCTTALCHANGQTVAWTRAGHRFTMDPFQETSLPKQDIADNDETDNQDFEDDFDNQENLTELKVDSNGLKSEPIYLRRAKEEPPKIIALKHPHGFNPASLIHPLTGQPRPLHFGNDNSTYSRQSRSQTIRPDPFLRQSCCSAPLQRIGSKTSRGSDQRVHSAAVKENGTLAKQCTLSIGETCEGPSPFMRPHNRFDRGLDQVRSQHHQDFLPPMPKITW